ncbi:MAG: DUF502 domain-containing protein [Planctomycetaceae bacterium]|nr:DUF502 domain-containing protein [Planctomycetaceae bacterium]
MTIDPSQPENPPNEESSSADATLSSRTLTPVRIFLRGLAVTLPAILTVVIVIWIFQFLNEKLVEPATWTVKFLISRFVDDSVPSPELVHIEASPPLELCGTAYLVTGDLRRTYFEFIAEQKRQANAAGLESDAPPDWNPRQQNRAEWMQQRANDVAGDVYVRLGPRAVPYHVYAEVARITPPGQMPTSAHGVYMEYVAERYLGSVIPLSVLTIFLIVVLLYFMGRFVSARIGRWIVVKFEEQFLGRLPVVRNVYGSVKQVTDFVFSENAPVEYRRVVAVEYPRKGIWTVGFATGESLLEVAIAAGEPCVAVLIPTSPAPFTGFTISVPRSEVLDLNITVEQAMQFCISCGVLTPKHQRMTPDALKRFVRSGIMKDPAAIPDESRSQAGAPSLPATPRGEGDRN